MDIISFKQFASPSNIASVSHESWVNYRYNSTCVELKALMRVSSFLRTKKYLRSRRESSENHIHRYISFSLKTFNFYISYPLLIRCLCSGVLVSSCISSYFRYVYPRRRGSSDPSIPLRHPWELYLHLAIRRLTLKFLASCFEMQRDCLWNADVPGTSFHIDNIYHCTASVHLNCRHYLCTIEWCKFINRPSLNRIEM